MIPWTERVTQGWATVEVLAQCHICRLATRTRNSTGTPEHAVCPQDIKVREITRRSWARRGAGDDQGHVEGPYSHKDDE